MQRFRKQVQGKESTAVRRLAKSYGVAEKDIRKRLTTLLRQMEELQEAQALVLADTSAISAGSGSPEGWMQLFRDRMTDMLPQINEVLDTLAVDGVRITENGQTQLVELSGNHARDTALAALGRKPRGVVLDWNRLDSDVVEALVGAAGDGSPLRSVFDAASRGLADDLTSAMASAVVQGINPKEAGRKLSAVFGTSKNRMETICRTEMLRAYRESTRRHYAANPEVVKGMRRVCIGDARSCAACFALSGREYRTDESIHIHAGCRCYLIPVTPSWGELLGRDDLPDTRPSVPTGDELFQRLSEKQQEKVLGPGAYAAYKLGAVRLSEMAVLSVDSRWGPTVRTLRLSDIERSPGDSGGDSLYSVSEPLPFWKQWAVLRSKQSALRVLHDEQEREISVAFDASGKGIKARIGQPDRVRLSLDLEELARVVGGTTIHNHPEGWRFARDEKFKHLKDGDSFSDVDVRTACIRRVGQTIAVTPRWVFLIRPPEGANWDLNYWEETIAPVYYRVEAETTKRIQEFEEESDEFKRFEAEFAHSIWKKVSEELGLRYNRREYSRKMRL